MPELPSRYEPVARLGAGGGGEVWSVRDRVTGRVLALKLLASGAGENEVGALVREAIALSGLEGLGVPQVIAFGALEGGRRYMVRELVDGSSLEEVLAAKPNGAKSTWLDALATACDQLTVVHRAGLLHGDIKPANVIVGRDGRGTLVDLGLAAPWREGGATAQGLTPKYAAPELFQGEALTVRAEVYSLGATLAEGLERRGDDVGAERRGALRSIAARALEASAAKRWPSVDELASAIRRAAGLPPGRPSDAPPWPVLGLEATARALLDRVRALPPGGAIVLEGPPGAGRSTLARRLAWTLGVHGDTVAVIEAPHGEASRPTNQGMTIGQVIELELAQIDGRAAGPSANGAAARTPVIIVDDAERIDDAGAALLRKASEAGARLVVVAPREVASQLARGEQTAFVVPALEPQAADDLVRRSVPSLPEALRAHLVARTGARPGPLRAAVRKLAGQPLVSKEEIDAALEGRASGPPSATPSQSGRARLFEDVERALDMGRFDDAARELAALNETSGGPRTEAERVRAALAAARVAVGRGDAQGARATLAAVEDVALRGPHRRAWQAVGARAALRAGAYGDATALARAATDAGKSDALAAEALSVQGVALAFTGDDAGARAVLDDAIRVARAVGDPRVEAVALGSSAIAHQRAGRNENARAAYEAALAAAERARDAGTVATMRLNLAALSKAEGDLAQALGHLEAAVDMGRRAGSGAALAQAWLNLANLDLYLGRWARARGSIDPLVERRADLSPAARAQLLGLEAEHAARTTRDPSGGQPEPDVAHLYEEAARAWESQGRAHDAAESRLEGLLARARQPGADPRALGRAYADIRAALGEAGFAEHAALAELVHGSIAHAAGDEETARRALDAAIDQARQAGLREWAWQALDARARLASAQGGVATARRDTESALAMLEETASKLPRDLREVFWDDPRRRALRQAHAATMAVVAPPGFAGITSGSVHAPLRGATEDRLARVLELTRELATEHDVPRLLQRVTDHAVALLGAERGFVLLVGDMGELEAHTARTGGGGDDPHAVFSRSVAERVVEGGDPVVTISARDDERLAQAVSVHQLMIQSIACVPIRGAPPVGRTIGALYVETRLRPGVRFKDELPILRAFADQAAISIENARLLAENSARAEQLARANVALAGARDELARTLGKRTEQLAEARRDLRQVRAELRGHFGYAGLVGTSAAMRRLYALIERVKDTDVALLVTGESGTGKEMVARAVHQAGPRAKKPFLGVNCGAIPANLLESELFGSVKGAFTDADRDRRGVFREAEGGTILLDEIGEMPQKMQVGLLRVLQEKHVRPLGGAVEEPVDVRVIAATHCDLEEMVEAGTFRQDLYYRLHVVELRVPPLRERVEDVPPLVDHFLTLMAARYRRDRKSVSREALRKLCALPWPGNVRQLEHVLLNAWLMSEGKEIAVDDLELPAAGRGAGSGPSEADAARARRGPSGPPRAENQAEFKAAEKDRILAALGACNWNRARAAEMIGVPRRTFYRRLKEFGLL
ncbi:MAG TPA: sigma 54-interacting transcriptional regulator [Polyangiaceae bacterium]|nr:sigma 54-interacting transcriptional regulator [Polyangiaceae bacterium]